ncbi:hypothetical protein [Tsukamurella pseudospumae]|uniref:Uncharacterized protein n=1 Tax=Tsukamurella pseudospumae TaxID=239498 RepID=A0A138AE64_9ACTN|nr:hypothetical protein [Tsukamurella pseudospumae]KXP08700.1 hypothetical protein AXK60_08480 [Tsukamurella pseudospumae]
MDHDELDRRAALYRVVDNAAALHRALDTLAPEAAARIGLTVADLDRISLLTSRALWSSTSDLHQRGEDELAHRVIARAAELEAGSD